MLTYQGVYIMIMIMSTGLLLIRSFLAIILALTILLALSFPHVVTPSLIEPLHGAPEPDIFEKGGYFYANRLWMLALGLLYLVSSYGDRKNLVWFTGWGVTLVVGVLVWPFLQVWYPEYLWPQFSYSRDALSWGMFYTSIFVAASVVLRLGLLRFLFPEPLSVYEGNEVELDRLDLSKARTVREIASSGGRVRASFLFGKADEGVVTRFYQSMRALMLERRSRWYLIFSALTFIALWFWLYPQLIGTEEHGLQRDRERMYEVSELNDGEYILKRSALPAAMRVLEPIVKNDKLKGMTIQQAEEYLGLSGLAPHLLAQLRDESPLESKSSQSLHLSRLRFLTLSDGKRRVILYLRLGADKKTINLAELEEEGWNPRVDAQRRILSSLYHNRAY